VIAPIGDVDLRLFDPAEHENRAVHQLVIAVIKSE
jgi:hypothetical protein